MRLADKVALVTGAGSGIGRATAELFAAEGARVVLADIDEAAARRVLDEMPAGTDGLALGCDIADGAAVERLFAEVERRYGRLDSAFTGQTLAASGGMLML